MRIVGGKLGGRTFNAPRGHRTHPMSDKVRGALFSVLGDIEGMSLLDVFAGSGAVSLEAVSRGVKHVVAIDRDKLAARAIKENIESLGVSDKVKLIHGNAVSWSNAHRDEKFDLVVLDPPYDQVLYTTLMKLARHTRSGGLLIVSLPADDDSFKVEGFELVSRKLYGDAQLIFFRNML